MNRPELLRRLWTFLILPLVIATIGVILRLYPLSTASNTSSEQAAMMVITRLRQSVALSVQRHHPTLSPLEQRRLAKQQFDELLRTEGDKARTAMDRLARELDTSRGDGTSKKQPYLLESDSFYYYSLTENLLTRGDLGGPRRGSKYLNPLMLAPEGHWEPFTLHPYVGAGIYKMLSVFSPGIPLMAAVSWTPVVIALLGLMAFVWVCVRLDCGAAAVWVGGSYFFLAEIFLKRSTWGWYDSDPYNILFPLLLLGVVIPVLRGRVPPRGALAAGLIAALLTAVYALFWQGWVFVFSVLAGGILLIFGVQALVFRDRSGARTTGLFLGTFLGGALAGVSLVFGPRDFFILFQEGWTALQGFLHPSVSLWPDLYIAVGELRRASPSLLLELTGGALPFLAAATAVIILLPAHIKKDHRRDLPLMIVLSLFFLTAAVLTLGAQRFALLCLVPVSVLSTLGMDRLFRRLENLAQDRRERLPSGLLILRTLIALLAAAVVIPPVLTAKTRMPSLLNQIYNDTWDEAMRAIREGTPENSVINTWWPPGHFIKTMARRRVTFDGATIQVPQAFWLARALITDNERVSLGILRMLNTSGHQAADYLTQRGFKLSEAVDLLLTVVPLDAAQARERLRGRLSADDVEGLLRLTHSTPPPSYLMLYPEMMEGHIQLSFVGNWNFRKVEELNALPPEERQVPKSGTPEYIAFLWKIAGGQPRFSGAFAPLSASADQILFDHHIRVRLPEMTCTVDSPTFGRGTPAHLIYLDGDTIVDKVLDGATLGYSAVLSGPGPDTRCALMDTALARSLLMKLYFFDGKGLKWIRPFFRTSDLTGRTDIRIYEVDWNGFLSTPSP